MMNRVILVLAAAIAAAPSGQDAPSPDRIAEHIVHALEPVPDERIVLRFDPETFSTLEPAVRGALTRAGARVDTWAGAAIEDFERRLQSTDVYVWLPGASRVTSAEQSAALRRWVDAGGTRRELHCHWSEGTLQPDGAPAPHTPAVDTMYGEALEIDYAGLKSRQDAAIAALRQGETRVTTPAGTDLRFRTGDRAFNRQDGDGSRRRVARARMRIDRHIELPAGVIRVAPVEASVRGVMAIPVLTRAGQTMRDVRLEIDAGRVVKGTARDGQAALDAMLAVPGLSQFREFGLGFNRALAASTRLIPYFGYGDGIVRLSLGDNEELGGTVRGGAVLWNFFMDATVTAGGRTLVENGRAGR